MLRRRGRSRSTADPRGRRDDLDTSFRKSRPGARGENQRDGGACDRQASDHPAGNRPRCRVRGLWPGGAGSKGAFHREPNVGDIMKPLSRLFLQAPLQALAQRRRRVTRQRAPVGVRFEHLSEDVGDALAAEGGRAGDHLVEYAAERPDIGLLVDRSPARLLGAHVGRGAKQHSRRCRDSDRRVSARAENRNRCSSLARARNRAPSRGHPA
jgi:hypothetical protein